MTLFISQQEQYVIMSLSLIQYFFLFIGQSGGVDEEFFTKSFEDVPKVQVSWPF